MSITFILIRPPGQMEERNFKYIAYPLKALGLRLTAGEVAREYPITDLGYECDRYFEARLVSLNHETFHSDKVWIVLDIGYPDLDTFHADAAAPTCTPLWASIGSWINDMAQTFGVPSQMSAEGFSDGVQMLELAGGAGEFRKRFSAQLKEIK